MLVQPYLFFNGRCEEAIEFYRKTVGAEVVAVSRFKDMPGNNAAPPIPPGAENKIMHMAVRIGETTVFASDGRCGGATQFEGFALSISVKTSQEAERIFAALGEGGQVQMPLSKTFFSPSFGMLIDRFGVCWMVIVMAQ